MISMDKKYRTRDGRDVRLLCVDGPEERPIVGVVGDNVISWRGADDAVAVSAFYLGYGHGLSDLDLIEYHEPDIRTIWVNVYEESVIPYANELSAKARSTPSALAIAQPVTFEVKREG